MNNDLQMLTTTQMRDIRGGEIIDGKEYEQGIELPKLPSLPASMPPIIPVIIPA